jgi:hypothetical protein
MDRSVAVRAALKAGVLGVFMGMFIPFLAILLTGALAVFFYRREGALVLPVPLASRLGGAAGVVAFAIDSIVFTIWIFVFHHQQQYIDSFTRFIHLVGADAAIPDPQATIQTLFTPVGLTMTLFLGMVLTVVLASVGGALASLILRPRNTRG